jgi:hypothetical protein
VIIFGSFALEKDRYELRAPFTGSASVKVGLGADAQQKVDDQKTTGFSRIVDFARHNTKVTLDIRPVEKQLTDIAFDFKFALSAAHAEGLWNGQQSLTLNGDGTVSTDRKNPAVQNSVKISGAWSNLWLYETGPYHTLEGAERPVLNAIGFRLEPAGVEASQDFTLVNYTAKPKLVFSVPYSDLPLLMWQETVGVNEPFLPLTAYAGYTYSSELKDQKNTQSRDRTHRADFELVYNAFIFPNLEAKFRAQWFMDLRENKTHRMVEASAGYFINAEHTAAIFVKLADGQLPPTFQGGKSVSVGFGLDF